MIIILAADKWIQELDTSNDETHTKNLKRQYDGTRNTELIKPHGIKVAK